VLTLERDCMLEATTRDFVDVQDSRTAAGSRRPLGCDDSTAINLKGQSSLATFGSIKSDSNCRFGECGQVRLGCDWG